MLQRKPRKKRSLTYKVTHKDVLLHFQDFIKGREMTPNQALSFVVEMELGLVIRLTSALSPALLDKVVSYAATAGKHPEQITREALAEHVETTIETDFELLQERLCSA